MNGMKLPIINGILSINPYLSFPYVQNTYNK